MNYKTQRAVSVGLGIASSIGTILTAYLVAKETPAACKKIEELKKKKDVKKIDYIKALVPTYYPAALVCGATIASTTASSIISLKTEASLIATSTMLSKGWNRYKDKVKEVLGKDAHDKVEVSLSQDDYENLPSNKNVKNDEELFWEEHIGFFKCSQVALVSALSDMNQRIHTPDPDPNGTLYWVTLENIIKDANAFVYEDSKKKQLYRESMGWTADYLCENYDIKCMWIHVSYSQIINPDDGVVLYTKIDFHEEPIYLIESERSRCNYRSRAEYEHPLDEEPWQLDDFMVYCSHGHNDTEEEYEQKIKDIQQEFIKHKPDCSNIPEEDDGRRFLSSNPLHTTRVKFANGRDVDHPESDDLKDDILPSIEEIPTL